MIADEDQTNAPTHPKRVQPRNRLRSVIDALFGCCLNKATENGTI